MGEENKYENLESLLKELQKALEMYNDLNPDVKMMLTPEEKRDVSDIFVCVYDYKRVGLFKKMDWIGYCYRPSKIDDAGVVFFGLDSNYVGIKQTMRNGLPTRDDFSLGASVSVDGKSYFANCYICENMSFDDMRLLMYYEGKIGPYEIGKASSQEMLEVLKYAFEYYQLDKETPSRTQK